MSKKIASYHVRVETTDDEWLLAFIKNNMSGNQYVTEGRNEEELWDMVADAILTERDVELSWWNRIVHKFKKY